jgi:signal peptidase I
MIGLTVDSLITICWLRRRLDLGAGKLFRAWFTQGVLNVVAGAIILFSASQCFTMQTWGNSSMSPNIRGYHVIEELPDGTHLINAATNPGDSWPAPGSESGGIVAETFEFVPRPRPDGYTHTADRFLCNKSKTPNRWDAIVFEPPAQPGFHSVKRLIGLPGERIRIRDGYVWVNGERLAPPERLGPIRYTNWTASAVLPEISLGLDEFFVLGDNPNKALDSRIWGPIPSYSIVGVAEVIYWPPSRWRMNP